ncbi:MAG: cytoplasmic protein [Desulfobacteraceae bacterium]|nr:MAG: cytoplasmic protein [Desulfobacteraceae bacterium]
MRTASGYSRKKAGADSFKEFDASQLYCPRCKRAVPVRKRLLLVLSEGDKYEYLCAFCSESVGTKIDKNTKPSTIIR